MATGIQNIAQLVAGFAEAEFARNERDKERKRQSGLAVAQDLASKGQLGELPPEVLESFAKSFGQDTAAGLMQINEGNAFNRQLQTAAQESISGPVTERTELLGPPEQNAAFNQEFSQLLNETADEQGLDFTDPQQNPFQTVNQVQETVRPATNQEILERYMASSPLAVATISGTLGLGQLRMSEIAAELDARRQDIQEMKGTFTVTEKLNDKTGEIHNYGVTTNFRGSPVGMVDLGPKVESGAKLRSIQKLEQLRRRYKELLQADAGEGQLDALERKIQTQGKVVDRLLEGPGQQSFVTVQDPKTGKTITMVGDGRTLQNQIRAVQLGQLNSKTALNKLREQVRLGDRALNILDEFEGNLDPASTGVLGKLNTLNQDAMLALNGGKELFGRLQEFHAGQRGALFDETTLAEDRKKILAKYDKRPGNIGTLKLSLAIALARQQDPGSAAKSSEVDVWLERFDKAGMFENERSLSTNLELIRKLVEADIEGAKEQLEVDRQERQELLNTPAPKRKRFTEGLFQDGLVPSAADLMQEQLGADTTAPPSQAQQNAVERQEPQVAEQARNEVLGAQFAGTSGEALVGQGTPQPAQANELLPGVAMQMPLKLIPAQRVAEMAVSIGMDPQELAQAITRFPTVTVEQLIDTVQAALNAQASAPPAQAAPSGEASSPTERTSEPTRDPFAPPR